EAVELFRQHQPDVVLMDLKMPQMGGVDAITTIRQEFPNARIIVLTTYDGDEDIYRGLSAGARGYLLKNVTRQELVKAIQCVHAGQKYIPAEVGARL
ncbi:response regulator, partial [Vogesella mureinivorans]